MAKTDTLVKPAAPSPLDVWREKTVPKDLAYADVAKTLADAGEMVSAAEFGTGFSLLDGKEKGRLVGVPFIILDWQINEGDFGPFVSLRLITNGSEKLIVNDGSSGICKQMQEIVESGNTKAIFVKKGLRKSDFEYTDPKTGEKKPATTYYLDTSA